MSALLTNSHVHISVREGRASRGNVAAVFFRVRVVSHCNTRPREAIFLYIPFK